MIKLKSSMGAGVILCGLVFGPATGFAQSMAAPRVSQQASVSQRIGLTDIIVKYHRPGVKGRTIWGDLVPYNGGKPHPWRAGANENTTISFTDDVKVEGKDLKAGTYGLHIIPSEEKWTIIFSNNSTSWGSFTYDEEEDALRVEAAPRENSMTEWLEYGFEDIQPDSVYFTLRWEKLKVPVKIEVDVHPIVLDSFRRELRSLPGFSWQGWNQAAKYCLDNGIEYEQGLKWIEKALTDQFAGKVNFSNLEVKSRLLEKTGKLEEAEEVIDKALEMGDLHELHFYGRSLIADKKPEKAIKVFKLNYKRNPNDKFTVHVGLARGYEAVGDRENAIKNWKTVIAGAPEGQKQYYRTILRKLENKGI